MAFYVCLPEFFMCIHCPAPEKQQLCQASDNKKAIPVQGWLRQYFG